eukprot:TRINITY_DN21592_c0_g2_i1.p1 TRINITY_DN21592_c0_g2~~TRINITY_DN21592_c0_g2_i1.p1  ORF type:complete len:401 (+),score=119.52 TRINITY_DN21592_c0_g2_i1:129-1331(+)
MSTNPSTPAIMDWIKNPFRPSISRENSNSNSNSNSTSTSNTTLNPPPPPKRHSDSSKTPEAPPQKRYSDVLKTPVDPPSRRFSDPFNEEDPDHHTPIRTVSEPSKDPFLKFTSSLTQKIKGSAAKRRTFEDGSFESEPLLSEPTAQKDEEKDLRVSLEVKNEKAKAGAEKKEKYKKIIAEFEERLDTLMKALEEKAKNSVELARQGKKDEITIRELKASIADMCNQMKKLEAEGLRKKDLKKELERRLRTVTQSLELLATQNLELKRRVPEDKISKLSFKVQTDVGTVQLLQEKINDLETRSNELSKKILHEQQLEASILEDIKTYENYVNKILIHQIKENIKKETIRRKAVEFQVKRLVQEVEELEFLVGKKDSSKSSSDSEDSSDTSTSSRDKQEPDN